MSLPRHDVPVPPSGYRWWYLDALSDDGEYGLTIIAFLGSVFSPYYAWARRRDAPTPVDPLDYCALNVALYHRGKKRWSLTERGRASLERSATGLRIGPSALEWDQGALNISIDEITAPIPSRLKGTVRLYPDALATTVVKLDSEGHHTWQPIAPAARLEVRFEQPACSWTGRGYLDTNCGDGPLEDAFREWTWSRAALTDGTLVLYDVVRRFGDDLALALRFDASGACESIAPAPRSVLPTAGWGIERATRSDAGHPPRLARTLEDTPFYARSLVEARLLGQPVTAVHESLSLDRFRARWVQLLLPFRMPRTTRAVTRS